MTREWVVKAEEDFYAAEQLAVGKKPLHNIVGFHCQQLSEKYLKALLEELGVAISKAPDLEQLLGLVVPHHPSLTRHRRGLRFLSGLAIHPRYPVFRMSKRQATSARRWAGKVRDVCRGLLVLQR
jgi:HEPN domain-containing protein